jgi:UDPglucose 6-dehydrogenase
LSNKIAIIGIGRLGLCLALNLERVGYEIIGIDVSQDYVGSLNQKTFSSPEPLVNEYLSNSRHFQTSTNLSEALKEDIHLLFLVLPTPSKLNGEFNHHSIDEVIEKLCHLKTVSNHQTIVINSTCMPGYCDSIQAKLQSAHFNLIYNPEFIAQGSIMRDQQQPDQVLIGEENTKAGDAVVEVYKKLCTNTPVFCRMSLISAEITKLATNCFLTTKIAFANAIGDIAKTAGAEPEKILQAIGSDSRIGSKYFHYGYGYGGPCFPRDNKAFSQFAKNNSYPAFVNEATDKSNEQHHEFLVMQYTSKFSKQDEIIFDSVTYKKGTDILEESQQLKLALSLAELGYRVVIKESAVVIDKLKKSYPDLFQYQLQ